MPSCALGVAAFVAATAIACDPFRPDNLNTHPDARSDWTQDLSSLQFRLRAESILRTSEPIAPERRVIADVLRGFAHIDWSGTSALSLSYLGLPDAQLWLQKVHPESREALMLTSYGFSSEEMAVIYEVLPAVIEDRVTAGHAELATLADRVYTKDNTAKIGLERLLHVLTPPPSPKVEPQPNPPPVEIGSGSIPVGASEQQPLPADAASLSPETLLKASAEQQPSLEDAASLSPETLLGASAEQQPSPARPVAFSDGASVAYGPRFTAGQRKVLALLGELKTTDQIAAELAMSPKQIKAYVKQITRQLSLSRTSASLLAPDILKSKGQTPKRK